MIATTIKRCAWVVAAMVALSAALAVLLPGIAEAQSLDDEDAVASGSTLPGSDTQVHQADAAVLQQQQPAYEPTTLRVVNPGDSLWTISQKRLQPDPTAEQIMNEVGRIYELNRDLIGDDPNLIFPGQELLLPAVYKPAVPVVPEQPGAAAEQAPEEAVAEQAPEEAVAEQAPEGAVAEQAPEEAVAEQASQRKLLGLAIIVLTVLVALLMVWRLPMKRAVDSSPTAMWGSPLAAVRRRFSSPVVGGRSTANESQPASGKDIGRRSSSPVVGGRSTANESQPTSGKEPVTEKAAASRRRLRTAPPHQPLRGDSQRRVQ